MRKAAGFILLVMGFGLWHVIGEPSRQKAAFAAGVLTVGEIRYELVRIPAGKFLMGAENRYPNESPVHAVRLGAFYMGRTEVTQELWQAVMGGNPAHFKVGGSRPVEKISWNDCQEFILRLNGMTGGGFRLPTEAEWEYACRAGSGLGRHGAPGEIAWYRDNSDGATQQVGGKKPNAWGLHDMLGNVLEWCQDWYGEKYYRESPASNPRGPESGPGRVVRGAGWRSSAEGVCCTIRTYGAPAYSFNHIGLRLSRDL